MAAVHIIANPASGDGTACSFVAEHVVPLIQQIGAYELFETTRPGAAEEYARQAVHQPEHGHNSEPAAVVFVVGGGDGTIHEIVNGIGETAKTCPVRVVLCPLGTANALYSTLFPRDLIMAESETEYRLQGVRAFLRGHFTPLTISKTSFYQSAANEAHIKSVYGVVVTSIALHAAILHSAEDLRQTVRGIDRFKIAAEQNISHWCNGSVSLVSTPSHNEQHLESQPEASIYDPITDRFTPILENILSGPFAYFISTTNVDRLESVFQISPLFSKLPPALGEMDLVVIRPLCDSVLHGDNELSRITFSKKLMNVLQAAYRQGDHIHIRHNDQLPHTSSNHPFVVEYIRTLGWTWTPEENDSRAHLVCVDGALFRIPPGGSVVCRTLNLNYSISK